MEKFDFSTWGFGAEMAHGADVAASDFFGAVSANPLDLLDQY